MCTLKLEKNEALEYFNNASWMQTVNIRFTNATKDHFSIGFTFRTSKGESGVMISSERLSLLGKFTENEAIYDFWMKKVEELEGNKDFTFLDMMYLYEYTEFDHIFFGKPSEVGKWGLDNFEKYFANNYDIKLFEKNIKL